MSELQTDLIGKRVKLSARRYGDWSDQGIGIVRMLSLVDGHPCFIIQVEGGSFGLYDVSKTTLPDTLITIRLDYTGETHWSMTVIEAGKPLKAPSTSPTGACPPSRRLVRTNRDLNGNITGIDVYNAGAWRSITIEPEASPLVRTIAGRDTRPPLIQHADIPDLIAALQEQL